MRLYGRSDVGRRRSTNEDAFILCEEEGLGVVCDGMGGHEAGEVASRMAVDLFAERVSEAIARLDAPGRKLSQLRSMAEGLIVETTQEANAAIHRKGRREHDQASARAPMGTTLAMVLVVQDFAVVAHVGDSRVYRMRDGVIERLTEDHTIVAEKRRRHPADPRPPRMRKFVTKALGTRPTVEPDLRLVEVFPGDLFLLCSDGLTDVVTDEEIAAVIRKGAGEQRRVIRSLVHLANKRGGPDNVTVVMAEVVGEIEDDEDTEALEAPG